jgi:transcriptional regulator with XRE-family HTH domain
MPDRDPDTLGARIATTRKLRRLTQRGLALAAGVGYSYLFQIEQGARQPSDVVLAAIARALSVPVADLTGQPYLEELRQDQLDGLIQPIREALDIFDLGADPDIAPRALPQLVTHADRICGLIRASDLRTAATELPALIIETTTAAHTTADDRLWSALATTYRSAYDIASKLGFFDLASIALDRMAWAAERASDPVAAGIRQYLRSLAYLRSGQYRTGIRIAEAGRRTAELAQPGPARAAVTGQLALGAAVLAARAQDRDTTEEYIRQARRIADGVGEIHRERWLTFGPTNVEVHYASALIDQTLYAEALQVARRIRIPADWPVSRAAHHHAEIARAQLWTGSTDAAFRSLLAARRLAPQQARHSPVVRETLAGLVRSQRTVGESIAGYAAWVGM